MKTDVKSESNISPQLIRVKRIDAHINALYELLKNRRFNISHNTLPTFNEHKLFVINNPYRVWYLIKIKDCFVGSIYILKDNCIGVYVIEENEHIIKKSIEWVLKKNKPLPAIKSVRAENFHINVSPNNKKVITILESMGATPIQVTFLFK